MLFAFAFFWIVGKDFIDFYTYKIRVNTFIFFSQADIFVYNSA